MCLLCVGVCVCGWLSGCAFVCESVFVLFVVCIQNKQTVAPKGNSLNLYLEPFLGTWNVSPGITSPRKTTPPPCSSCTSITVGTVRCGLETVRSSCKESSNQTNQTNNQTNKQTDKQTTKQPNKQNKQNNAHTHCESWARHSNGHRDIAASAQDLFAWTGAGTSPLTCSAVTVCGNYCCKSGGKSVGEGKRKINKKTAKRQLFVLFFLFFPLPSSSYLERKVLSISLSASMELTDRGDSALCLLDDPPPIPCVGVPFLSPWVGVADTGHENLILKECSFFFVLFFICEVFVLFFRLFCFVLFCFVLFCFVLFVFFFV